MTVIPLTPTAALSPVQQLTPDATLQHRLERIAVDLPEAPDAQTAVFVITLGGLLRSADMVDEDISADVRGYCQAGAFLEAAHALISPHWRLRTLDELEGGRFMARLFTRVPVETRRTLRGVEVAIAGSLSGIGSNATLALAAAAVRSHLEDQRRGGR